MVVGRNKSEIFKNIKVGIRKRLRGSKENMLPKAGKISCFDSNYKILSVQGNGFFDEPVLVEWTIFIKGQALVEMEKAVYSICLTKKCMLNKLGSYSRIVTHWWIKHQGQDIYAYICIPSSDFYRANKGREDEDESLYQAHSIQWLVNTSRPSSTK